MPHTDFRTAAQGSSEIQLTVTGRSSGKSHTYPIWFAVDGNTLYLIPVRGSDTEWYKNIRKSPTIRLESRGQTLTANARVITDQTKLDSILEKFREKYGRNVKSYYPKYDVAVDVAVE